MPSLAATTSRFLVGDCVCLKIFSQFQRTKYFHGSVQVFKGFDFQSEPLTLGSLGLKRETKITSGNDKNKRQLGISTVEFPKSKVKEVGSRGVLLAGVKNSLEIESAPFAAKSFPELGLPKM